MQKERLPTYGVSTNGADPPRLCAASGRIGSARATRPAWYALLACLLMAGLASCQSGPEVAPPTVTPVALAAPRSSPQDSGLVAVVPLTASVVSTGIVTSNIVTSNIVTSGIVTSGIVTSGIVTSGIVPSNIVPSNIVPSNIVPSGTGISVIESTGPAATSTAAQTPLPPVLVLAPNQAPTIPPTATPLATPELGIVKQVINGDTLLVEIDGADTLVGYLLAAAPGLDTPLGELAREYNRTLAEGQTVRLEREVSDIDRDHRRLRFVYLSDGTLLNAEMLRQGWAEVAPSPLDPAREQEFRELETGARGAGIGMWAGLRNAVTNQVAEVRSGPDPTFPVVQTLPINALLAIDGMTPEADWYRLQGGVWIASRFVTHPPPVDTVPFAEVDTPVPTATATQTPTPTATPTVSPTPTFAIGSVQIVYVDKINEYLVLRNGTNRLLDLKDWKILSERGGEICTLAGQLASLDTLIVWSQRGPNFACHFEFPIWDDLLDDSALLYSPSGFIIHRYEDPMNIRPAAEEGGGTTTGRD